VKLRLPPPHTAAVSFSRSLGWHRVWLSREAPTSSQCAARVSELYSLRGAEGAAAELWAGLSWRQSATRQTAWLQGTILFNECNGDFSPIEETPSGWRLE
jgi:hypothetical protein